jgi:hypothetical protein
MEVVVGEKTAAEIANDSTNPFVPKFPNRKR